jgi:recombination protein RecA
MSLPPPALRVPPAPPATPLETLLRDLGANLVRGGPAPPPAACFLPTGLAAIDRVLGGGFPRGRVSEVVGPACCGRTSLALALLARVTAQGELAVLVDRPDVFDAASAAHAGVDLERVLWVRPAGLGEALRSVEHVLQAGGFPLVLLDLALEAAAAPRIPSSVWPRLRKATAASTAALVLLGRQRLAGTFADLALELDVAMPCFESGPDWLAGLDGRARRVRSRSGPAGSDVAVHWPSGGRHAA